MIALFRLKQLDRIQSAAEDDHDDDNNEKKTASVTAAQKMGHHTIFTVLI